MAATTACIGHRGLPLLYPENTLPSFLAALDAGAAGIELDVRLTADREVVVLHDATLDRTTTATGPVAAVAYDLLRSGAVLARSTFLGLDDCFPCTSAANDELPLPTETPPFPASLPVLYAPVPRLVDVLDMLLAYARQDVTLIIDIKWDNSLAIMPCINRILDDPAYAPLLPRITLGIWSALFVPFLPRRVSSAPSNGVGPASGRVKRSLICSSYLLARLLAPWIDSVSIDKDVLLARPSIVASLKAIGKQVTVWTPDSVADVRRVADLGVDGIISNCVPLTLSTIACGSCPSDVARQLQLQLKQTTERGSSLYSADGEKKP